MSLEEKVDALTSAIAGLTIAMQAQLAAISPVQQEAVKPAASKETKPTAKAGTKKEDAAKPETTAVTFEDLKQAVVAAADKDKPATAAALKKFNVAKISELKEDQFEEALAALKAVVRGTPTEDSFV